MPPEKPTAEENAPVSGDDQRPSAPAGAGDPHDQDAGGTGSPTSGQLQISRAKPKKHLTAEEVLNDLGDNFIQTYQQDTGKAWSDLMLTLMRHLALLTRSGVITNLKDILAVARDVEEHIRKTIAVGGGDGELRLPMDEIGAKWRVEQPSDESAATPTQTKKRSRRKTESSNKSTTSSESPNSSVKIKSETNGFGP